MSKFELIPEQLASEFPKDVLFYPCCGRGWRAFRSEINGLAMQFHFADIDPGTFPKVHSRNCPNHFYHARDAVQVLKELPKISIFFYVGDSGGEGSSSLCWWGAELLPLILDKLEDGGLIITDGSYGDPNCHSDANECSLDEVVPLWFASAPHGAFLAERANQSEFRYLGRIFNVVEALADSFKLKHQIDNIRTWRVTRLKITSNEK